MFAKLKQKIQEEDLSKKVHHATTVNASGKTVADVDHDQRTSSNDDSTSNGRATFSDNQSQASFSITDSPTSPDRSGASNNLDSNSTTNTSHHRHEPRTVTELTRTLSEERRMREKLQTMLEKQQDVQSKRIEEKEAEWRGKFEKLEKDSAEWRQKFEETSPWKERYIRDHEAVEELEGFQVQELSKVKHLLLISQQELQEQTVALKEKEADLSALRSTCFGLNDELTQLRGTCERLEDESSRAQVKSRREDVSIRELHDVNETLNQRLADIRRQLEEEGQAGRLQQELSDLRDQHGSLQHSHDVQMKRDRALLDAKDLDIAHLESRLAALERRLADVDLGDDDRLARISAERDALEVKLDECRQHLSEVKSTWSERIETLETQISHLNSKIAEDREDTARCEQSNCLLRSEVSRVEGELRDSREAAERQKFELNDRMQKALDEKEATSNLLLKRIDDCETRLSCANDERERLSSNHKDELKLLEETRLDELRRTEREKADLLVNNSLLEKTKEKHEGEISELEEKIVELKDQVESMQDTEIKVREDLLDLESRLKKMTEVRDLLLERIELRSKEDEIVSKEKEESRINVESMRDELGQLRSTLEAAKNEIDDLKKTIVDVESSIEVKDAENSKLNSTVALLETQLAERNKVAKLQRQRLGDMKKTLQRELQAAGRPCNLPPMPGIDCANESDQATDNNIDVNGQQRNQHPWSSIAMQSSMASPGNHFNSMGTRCSSLADKLDDINFRYVKHVILKFMTSTEYEAHQLIKAIGVLLEFSRDEERLVRDTLNWKASWFGTKPQQAATRSRVGNRTVI